MQLTDRFQTALVYAAQLHQQQVRKCSGVPYISHLLSVAALVLEDGGNEDEAIAALLHDAIEDQGGAATMEVIRDKFGETVTSIVNGCTESDITPKPPWKERKLQYIEHLHYASSSVHRVAIADKLHNARSLLADWYRYGDEVWSKFQGEKEETLWFYRSILATLRQKNDSYLLAELAKVIRELERLSSRVTIQ